MAKTTFTVFKKNQVMRVLESIGIRTKKKGVKEFISDENGDIARCGLCEKNLTPENLGNVIKGSKILLCDNPACFNGYLVENKLEAYARHIR